MVGQDLHRDEAVEARLVRLVHDAHSAASQLPAQLEVIAEDPPSHRRAFAVRIVFWIDELRGVRRMFEHRLEQVVELGVPSEELVLRVTSSPARKRSQSSIAASSRSMPS